MANVTLGHFLGNGANEIGPIVAIVDTTKLSSRYLVNQKKPSLCASGVFLTYSMEVCPTDTHSTIRRTR